MKKLLNKLTRLVRSRRSKTTMVAIDRTRDSLVVIPRNEHCLSRKQVSPNAVKVLNRLKRANYSAYLVGGCVRDLLSGFQPKDFDVVTDALPNDVKRLFTNCRLIGRRFRLAHILYYGETVEVATFRGVDTKDKKNRRHSEGGMILRDNIYGCIEEDIWRRDFTVNALYYNIADFSIWDYTGGVKDLEDRLIRIIGDPYQRYQEDPVRMLRAIRFAAKLDFDLEPLTEAPIKELGHLIAHVASARLYEEVIKLLLTGKGTKTFEQLMDYELVEYLFVQTDGLLQSDQTGEVKSFIQLALKNSDERIEKDLPVSAGFLFAALLWHPLLALQKTYKAKGFPNAVALEKAASDVITQQVSQTAMPRRINLMIRQVWHLQNRLNHRSGRQVADMLRHPRFRAAYDFLLLRSAAGEKLMRSVEFWTKAQEGVHPQSAHKRRRRHRIKQ